MSYRLSVDVIGSKELDAAFKRAPETTTRALSGAIGRTAFRIEGKAKQYAPIEHGNLRGSITTQGPRRTGNDVQAKVGTNIEYARYQEEGTGVYGPKKQMIVPRNGRVFAWKRGGKWVYARKVRGVKPQRYFRRAKEESTPYLTEQMRAALAEIVSALAR